VLYDIPTGDPLLDPLTRYWIGLTGGGGVIGAAWSLTNFDSGGYGRGRWRIVAVSPPACLVGRFRKAA